VRESKSSQVTPVQTTTKTETPVRVPPNIPLEVEANQALHIKRRPASQTLNQQLQHSWHIYQSGDFVAAEQSYRSALKIAPQDRQALLGLAATCW
jgi:Tfp pilus assembly protein PilF